MLNDYDLGKNLLAFKFLEFKFLKFKFLEFKFLRFKFVAAPTAQCRRYLMQRSPQTIRII